MANARQSDPETSHLAAATISESGTARSQRLVLSVLAAFGPKSDAQILELSGDGFSPSRLRTARKELVTQGKIRNTFTFHETRRGSRKTLHIIWALVEPKPQLRLL